MFRLIPLFAILGASAAASAAPLTLADLYSQALRQAEDVQIVNARKEQAEERLNQANGAMLPNLSGHASYQRLDDNGAGLDQDNTNARLTLTQPLYRGGSEYAARRAARLQVDASGHLTEQTKRDLYVKVAQVFYQVTMQAQDIADLKTLINLTERRVKDLRQRAKIGRSRAGEVLAAQSQVAILQSQVKDAEIQLAAARADLQLVTGLPPDTELKSELSAAEGLRSQMPALDKLTTERGNPPLLKALQAETAAIEEQVAVARGSHLPQLDLQGNYYLQREGALEDSQWDVMLTLTVPLYSGGIVQSQVREARAELSEKKLQLRQAQRESETGLKKVYDAVNGRLAQLAALETAVKVSEDNYNAQLKDFRYSLVTNLEVLQALNSFQEAKRSFNRVRAQTLLAWAQLQAELGKLPQ